MRIFFEDPTGHRLAIDTNRQEWAANYAELPAEISNEHYFVNVNGRDDLELIEKELDFNGWNYSQEMPENRHGVQTSVYTEYLRELATFSALIDTGNINESTREAVQKTGARIERANDTGYFSKSQYKALNAVLFVIIEELEQIPF